MKTLFLAFLFASTTAYATPAQVLLIRHAEKLLPGNDSK